MNRIQARPIDYTFRCFNGSRLRQSSARLGLKGVFGDGDQLRETGGIPRSDVGQNLPVEFTLGGLEALHETAVGQAGGTDGGVPTST